MDVTIARTSGVAVLEFSNGPANVLSIGSGFLKRIRDVFEAALTDPAVSAIVITGAGRMFCGGADIADFDGDTALTAQLRETLGMIENSDKPVIAALHGMALGGGLELALACHYRFAQGGTRLGLPEVTLGLVPGAGGTQRLPRLANAGPALDLMLSGKPISADKAKALGIVDEVVEDHVISAVAFAQFQPTVRRTGELAIPTDLDAAVASARACLKPDTLSRASERIVECVAQISDDLSAGVAAEARAFDQLLASEAALGLRHAFFGERIVRRIPGLAAGVQPRSIRSIGVVGGGLMGTGIAIALLNAGFAVTLVETRDKALAKAQIAVVKAIQRDVEKGRIQQSIADTRLASLDPAPTLSALKDVDLVIEAVFEDMAVKKEVFSSLELITRPDTIFASNTSTLDIDAIAAGVSDPSRVIGLHFFSPANVMRLLEIVRGRETAPDVLATAMDVGQRMGKICVVSGVCDGFIGNRIFEEYLRQVWFLIEEGAAPQQIDTAMETWGMAMGPCRTMDMVGQDIGWAIRKRRAVEQPDRPYSGVIDRICELGRFGQKTGKGIYDYPGGGMPVPDAEIDALIAAYSAELGLTRRTISDEEIVDRCLLAMANEGAKIVSEGIAYRPIDIDMTLLNGYGFARERGGPMFQADLAGLPALLDRLRARASARNGWAWAPAPLIETLLAGGERFGDLNR
ncbi:3-hydroxyacyl-CoA dehydrogenase [Nostoc sp. 3335mG]|nr:3-hydroxyacyl-CoA dehydrogenase [Nostoc sp. 3335mG]